jgi:hypothetical protein
VCVFLGHWGMPTVWVSDELTALNPDALEALDIAVLVRCVGKAQAHIKGIFQVDASVFSSSWGRGGPYDCLQDVHCVIFNIMQEVSFASKHDPSQSRDHARLCIFHQWKYEHQFDEWRSPATVRLERHSSNVNSYLQL